MGMASVSHLRRAGEDAGACLFRVPPPAGCSPQAASLMLGAGSGSQGAAPTGSCDCTENNHGSFRGDRPQAAALRREPARQASGRSRHRRARGHVQAQRAVPARRLSLLLFRQHGCHRRQPIPSHPRLSQGQARAGRLCRLRHGEFRKGARQVLAGGPRPRGHGQRGGDAAGRGAHQEAGWRHPPGRRRSRISSRRRRGGPAPGVVERRHRRCGGAARAAAGAQDFGGARLSARSVRTGGRHRCGRRSSSASPA